MKPPPSPLVFAHRGASTRWPEHTVDAYLAAIDDGADGLECDVRLTRDGHLICIHDRRLDRTSDGSGRVSEASLAELKQLDFGGWRGPPAGPMPRTPTCGAASSILTLDRLITTALDAGRPLRLLIETKHPTRYGALVEARLVELLRRRGLVPGPAPVTVTVMSFSALALGRLRQLAPEVPTVYLFELPLPVVRDGWAPFRADALGPELGTLLAHPSVVRRAHERGRQVYVWTVNDTADIDRVVELGVDGVISDRPGVVLSRLGRR